MIAAAFPLGSGTADGEDAYELFDLAQKALRPARALLNHFGAPLLTVAMSRTRTRVVPWARALVVGEEIADEVAADHGLTRALDEVRLHGGGVCAVLARRWPANATPLIIGVVTDGVGMAVSGGHPCGLTPEWLIDHLAGRATVDVILPFGKPAALLLQPTANARLQ